jgi:hypothetical protein
MAVINWVNQADNYFTTAAAWVQHVVPGVAATAVISSSGDGKPYQNPATDLISPNNTDSVAFLLTSTNPVDQSLSQDSWVLTTSATGAPEWVDTTSTQSSDLNGSTGDTLTGGTLDLLGAGSEAGLVLQNTTLGSKVHVNISGDAYAYAGYTNTLAGTIDIGLPFTIAGATVPTPPIDADGMVNALYLDIRAYGSWTNSVLNGYVPGVTNTGTIAIGASSILFLSIAGQQQSSGAYDGAAALFPQEVSAFTNKGVIDVKAGGFIYAASQYLEGKFINNGIISIAGAKGDLTETRITTAVSGTGTFVLAGGTQTEASQTEALFSNTVSGQTFVVNDATLDLDASGYIYPPPLTYSGGHVTFSGTNGVLLISTPIILDKALPVNTVFSDSISGFAKGDQIQLAIRLVAGNTPIAVETSWDQTSGTAGTLDVSLVTTSSLGTTTTTEAALALHGKYTNAAFSGSLSGTSTGPTLTITTKAAAAAASTLLPGDWTATSELGVTGTTMQGAASSVIAPNTSSTTDGVAAFGHLDLQSHAQLIEAFHLLV